VEIVAFHCLKIKNGIIVFVDLSSSDKVGVKTFEDEVKENLGGYK